MDISPIMRRVANRFSLPPEMPGPHCRRREPCDFCGSFDSVLLAKMDYWDLSEHDLVRCSNCGLMQVDPMLTEENLALGCRAFFRFDRQNHGGKEIRRTCLRNFRKGVAFGVELEARGILPKRSLELGAGDAYFSRGLKFVFPQLHVTCLDVVPEVIAEIRKQHGFDTISVAPELMTADKVGTFDLVIARDILEHVRRPSLVLQNIHNILDAGGLFHFITPVGYEDVWFTYGFWQLHRQASEYLINHVSFFPTATLRQKLEATGFTMKRWIVFDFKGTLREGKGRRFNANQLANPSMKRSASAMLGTPVSVRAATSDPTKLLNVPWMKSESLARLFCHKRHRPRWYADAELGIGHEIYGLAVKD